MKNLFLLAAILGLVWGCSKDGGENADVLYVNGVVWTGAQDAPDADAVAVKDGRIIFAGAADNFTGEAEETVDLDGRFMAPGFIDNHVHFLDGGFGLASVDLRDAATPEEFSKRIIDYAATLPEGRWVLNGNWDHERWGGELPRVEWIDEGTGSTPVFVVRLDGHMALANSAAMALAGVTAETQAPEGGEIVRDENGEPAGVFKDNAMSLIYDVIPEPSEEELLDVFQLAQDHALSLGLTQVHDVGGTGGPNGSLRVFREAKKKGLLKLRIYSFAPLAYWEDARERVADEGKGDEMLRWGGLKGFVDGSLGSTTAWFYEPFTDAPETSGFPVTDPDELAQLIADADAAGLHIAVHAIGDKAIDTLLSDFETAAGDEIVGRRYRIEHFQHPTHEAISRAARDGVIASMQPYHAIDDGRWAEKRIGPERIKTTYAFRSILDEGGLLTFGSDWPVAPLSPIEGVYAAVTRRTIDGANPDGWQPQEKISVEEALTAYTATNAYAGLQEDELGKIALGMAADFVVLSDDPRAVEPAAIKDIRVLKTIVGGEEVYSAAG
ncbi:amidohydrolase [Hyphococcus luteus]|nr:amidohydrolase [Marinicaulis flavus]